MRFIITAFLVSTEQSTYHTEDEQCERKHGTKQDESQLSDSLSQQRGEVAESEGRRGKKRSKRGQKKVNKVKDSSEQEKYLSCSQMFLFEMESRWFHQTDEPFGHTSSITLVKP